MTQEPKKHEYIGDGVYLSDDGYQLWLAVNSHENAVVALEPNVFLSLIRQGSKRLFGESAATFLRTAAQGMEEN